MTSNAPAPVRLADLARVTGKTSPDDYVWHFVLHKAGQNPKRGERLATLALGPSDVVALGLEDMRRGGIRTTSTADALTVGLQVLERALEAERREWVRRTTASGYVDGWGVGLVAERGYRRSLFRGIAPIVTPGGTPA